MPATNSPGDISTRLANGKYGFNYTQAFNLCFDMAADGGPGNNTSAFNNNIGYNNTSGTNWQQALSLAGISPSDNLAWNDIFQSMVTADFEHGVNGKHLYFNKSEFWLFFITYNNKYLSKS